MILMHNILYLLRYDIRFQNEIKKEQKGKLEKDGTGVRNRREKFSTHSSFRLRIQELLSVM